MATIMLIASFIGLSVKERGKAKIINIVLLLSILGIIVILPCNIAESGFNRIVSKFQDDNSLKTRYYIKKLTWEMITHENDNNVMRNIIYGRGINSYRSLSEPFSLQDEKFIVKNSNNTISYVTAGFVHCDILQILFEFGLIGATSVIAWTIWFFSAILKRIKDRTTFLKAWCGVSGISILLLYALNDNIVYNFFVAIYIIALAISTENITTDLREK